MFVFHTASFDGLETVLMPDVTKFPSGDNKANLNWSKKKYIYIYIKYTSDKRINLLVLSVHIKVNV